jgi:hypothetical protein
MVLWTTDQVQAASSVAGVVVAIAGFVFIAYQIRQIGQAGRAGAHASIFSHYLEVTRLMLDNPEIRPYLYDGKKLSPDDPNYAKVLFACEVFGDFYEHVSLQRENLPHQSLECWDKAIADRYRRNPTLRTYLDARRHLYAPELFSAVQRGSELLDTFGDGR